MRKYVEFDIPPAKLGEYYDQRPDILFPHALGTFSLGWFAENGWSLYFEMRVPTTHKVRPKIYFYKGGHTGGRKFPDRHRLYLKMQSLFQPPLTEDQVITLLEKHPVVFTNVQEMHLSRLSLDEIKEHYLPEELGVRSPSLQEVFNHFSEEELLAALNERIKSRLKKRRPQQPLPDLDNVVSLLERIEQRQRPALPDNDERIKRLLAG